MLVNFLLAGILRSVVTERKKIILSALDQSPVRSGGTATDALLETVELAQACEAAGYHRYWVAEHHASTALAGPAPEIMISQIANATKTIRVGSGGVMLSHYSPLKVAETFNLLETLNPGRIDLGIGRAPGSDHITAAALAYGSQVGIEYFPSKVADLMAFIDGSEPPTKGFEHIKVTPMPDAPPQMWMLGSSDQSALMAAQFGLAFSFAQFIVPSGGDEVLTSYRKYFQPSEFYSGPKSSLCVFIICAETEAEAARLSRSRDYVMLMRERGRHGPFPSVEEAEAYDYNDNDRFIIERNRSRCLYGDPGQCQDILTKMAMQYGVDELVILTICFDPTARRKSYQLLADAFDL